MNIESMAAAVLTVFLLCMLANDINDNYFEYKRLELECAVKTKDKDKK